MSVLALIIACIAALVVLIGIGQLIVGHIIVGLFCIVAGAAVIVWSSERM
jgi:hypothetical protein